MQPSQTGQVEGPVLVFVLSPPTVGEVALRRVAKARMSQDFSGRKETEGQSSFCICGIVILSVLSSASVQGYLPTLPPGPHPSLPLKNSQALALSFAASLNPELESTSHQTGEELTLL